MECQICLTEISGHQWGIYAVNLAETQPDSIEFDHEGGEYAMIFSVHPYCMNEAVECYTMELADGFLENEYMLERKNADK